MFTYLLASVCVSPRWQWFIIWFRYTWREIGRGRGELAMLTIWWWAARMIFRSTLFLEQIWKTFYIQCWYNICSLCSSIEYTQKEHQQKNVRNTRNMPHGTCISTMKIESFNYMSKRSFDARNTHITTQNIEWIQQISYMPLYTVSHFFMFFYAQIVLYWFVFS